jgi:folate-binding protein YgfZ
LIAPSARFADVSARARLVGTGKDLLDLLHRLSTQDLRGLPVGRGLPTVLTSPKGRIVERLFVHRIAEREVLLSGGDDRAGAILAHLRKFTFAEDTGLTDVTPETVCFALLGGDSALAVPDPGPWGGIRTEIDEIPVTVLGQDGYTSEGRSVVAAARDRDRLRDRLAARAEEIDLGALEVWRIERGHPAPGRELTEDWNPLEAGLRDHVSFTKGCYVGQEVVARLNTYDKVSRTIARVRFSGPGPFPAPGTPVESGNRPIGRLTSLAAFGEGGAIGLAYVKRREVEGGAVTAGGRAVEIVMD